MNPKLHNILKNNLDIYPHVLEEKFPRVFNKMMELWDTPHIEAFLRDLMMDNRAGNRQGFPPEAASEIIKLGDFLDSMKNSDKEVDAWEGVRDFRRHELDRFGYEFTAQGLLKSVEDNNDDAVRAFISCGVDLEVRDDRNWTPLMVAAFNGNFEFSKLLIQCGSHISAKDTNGYSALHWAAYNGHVEIIKLLIEKETDPNQKSQYGWTALMQAATRGHLLACAYLIFRGADVNLATSDGWTSLHKAANNGHTEVVKLLLAKGANRFAKYQNGKTAIDLAIKAEHLDIVELLNKTPIGSVQNEKEELPPDNDLRII
jgi:hypothetical protein